MQVREIPFLRLTVPLCAGVIVAECLPQLLYSAAALVLITLITVTVRLFRRSHQPDIIYGAAITLFFVSTGYILRDQERRRPGELEASRQEISLRLSGYPSASSGGCSIRARIISVSKNDTLTRPVGSMLLRFMSDTIPSQWKPGDIVQLMVRPLKITNNGNPCEFNYVRWMEGQGIRYMAFFRAADITGFSEGSHRTIREEALRAANGLAGILRRAGLQREELGLVLALTIGDKELLERDHLTSFSRSGVMHVMAVSGLHVGMVQMALSWMLFFLRGRLRRVKTVIIVPALWGFAFITGLTPSVLRATIMFTFLQTGNILHRPATSMNNLLASAFILTAAHPGVIFEAGFQLSYIAVAFIVIFYSRLYRLLKFESRVADYFWQIIAVSLVAQAGTLALSIRLFNIFPLLFLPANIVIIPVAFLVLMLAILLLVTSPFPALSSLFAILLDRLASFTLGFTGLISSARHGVIQDIGMSSAETIMLTITSALLLASLFRLTTGIKPFLVAATLLLMCNIIKTVEESHHERVITYKIRGDSLTVRQHGRRLILPSPPGEIPSEIRRHAVTRGLKIEHIEPG